VPLPLEYNVLDFFFVSYPSLREMLNLRVEAA